MDLTAQSKSIGHVIGQWFIDVIDGKKADIYHKSNLARFACFGIDDIRKALDKKDNKIGFLTTYAQASIALDIALSKWDKACKKDKALSYPIRDNCILPQD